MTVDDRLKELGFELISHHDHIRSFTYENKEADQRVTIEYVGGGDWIIHSKTISEDKDWYGNLFHSPVGMTYEECKAFLDKIDELKMERK